MYWIVLHLINEKRLLKIGLKAASHLAENAPSN
jgi:hypothetical protein